MKPISISISYQIEIDEMCEMLCLSCLYAVGMFVIALEEFLQCWGTWGFIWKSMRFKYETKNGISTWYQIK